MLLVVPAVAVTVTARATLTVTTLLIVAVLLDALAPVVGIEVSVTVAAIVNVPEVDGAQFTTNGEVPVAVPINTPFTDTCTEEMVALFVGVALTLISSPFGVVTNATGDPVAGN